MRVDDRLLEPAHAALRTRALKFLEAKLFDIKMVVPAERLQELQEFTIVLDLTCGDLRSMQYHPSAGWLKANGYPADLAKCVHLPRAADLATRRNINEQPWVILHELAHAYHDQVLGFDDPQIIAAYEQFKASGRGDTTLLYNGKRVAHYALTDHKEFFAEMTESFFGVNDFFPFNRAELEEAEPDVFRLLSRIWIHQADADDSGSSGASAAQEPGQGEDQAIFTPRAAESLTVPPGFRVEQVFEVPPSMGSWVSLAADDSGSLFASDQGDAGLYLITPPPPVDASAATHVEKLPVPLSQAQGLLWAFDSLYVTVNGDDSGLYRATDSTGDGRVDTAECLMPIPGRGEHGPHAIVLAPDGQSLFLAAGNHTPLPAELSGSRIPRNWGEDQLLPRRWGASGHEASLLAPGGWIGRIDPEGKTGEVFSIGYRNHYDMAFNADGELFTFDSDKEGDMGSPWYRPTRVTHVTSGSEFGWRSGSGKWPDYYEDSLPPAIDVGPGSPTGVVFGQGAKFPAKYQRALFALDWTYGTIHAIQLKPEGASYRGEAEDFVAGHSLPVTAAVVGADGALYFTVGGRGTQSALYRVVYVGDESTEPVDTRNPEGSELRQRRRHLEAMHGREGGDLDTIFAHLGHPDRFIRYAARLALEAQPVEQWRGRAIEASEPRMALTALMALARQGTAEDLGGVLESLGRIDGRSLDVADQLTWLRIHSLAFIRLGEPDEPQRRQRVEQLDALYPSDSDRLNAELVQLLVYLRSPSVVEKTLALMDSLGPEAAPDWGALVSRNEGYGGTVARMLENMPPTRRIHHAFVLRNVEEGWTLDQRRRYFSFFLEAAKHSGGANYTSFLIQMREDALATCTPAERVALDAIAGQSLVASVTVVPPEGPGRPWTRGEALEVLGRELRGRSFDRGRNLFHAASCAKCHRFDGEGGAIGPELSTVARRFSLPDLIDAIVDPSKVVSDQYGSHQVITSDGVTLVGRTVEIDGNLHVYTSDPDAPPVVIHPEDVEEIVESKVSQMPTGLIDTLNAEELKDLVAYLLSEGNRNSAVFGR